VAYSTCSQLGYMFFSSGLSNYSVSLFHLFNHAFFKALLFLSMGSIIHALMDEQDFRRMGGLVRLLPFTYVMVLLGSLALLGFPFLTGFYSKDFLLEFAYARYSVNSFFFYLLGVLAAFFSAFYSTRLIYWVFLSKPNFFKSYLQAVHEPTYVMKLPLFLLGVSSIFVGYLFSDAMNGVGSIFFGNSIFQSVDKYFFFEAEFSLFLVKYVPLIISLLGIFLFFFSLFYFEIFFLILLKTFYIYIYKFFTKALYFDIFYVDTFFDFVLKFSYLYLYKFVEKRIMEFFFIFCVTKLMYVLFRVYKGHYNGLIFNYFFSIVFFFIYIFLMLEFLFYIDFCYLFILVVFYLMNSNRINYVSSR
jgi:NADH-ubiquinone oxidoreductase chain 5